MQKRILCVIFTIIIITTISMTSQVFANETNKEDINLNNLFNRYIIFGLMSQTNEPYGELMDFEINKFALIFGDNQIQTLNQGEMVRLHGTTFGIMTNNIFIGIISDWSIIG